jgi:phospho-N-acetylmuramoyl-pentapeptide-transferase
MNAILMFFMCGFLISLFAGYPYIRLLKRVQSAGQPIRVDGPKHHVSKAGTTTMGGALIILPVILSIFFAPEMWSGVSLGLLLVFIGYAAIGAVDDFKKVMKRNSYGGMTPRQKLISQIIIAFVGWLIVHFQLPEAQQFLLYLPIIDIHLNLWYAYIPFALFVIVGASNAVNLTDGLDGLVTVPVVITLSFFLLLILWIQPSFMVKLPADQMNNVAHLILLIIGGCLGFLYFNLYPAKIFMGDIGSLALGGLLGILSLLLKAEFFLAMAGLIFVIETVSVIIQVVYFRRTGGKRFFKMAPIHHHFEYSGWSEQQVVKLFWTISAVSAYVALCIAALGNRL